MAGWHMTYHVICRPTASQRCRGGRDRPMKPCVFSLFRGREPGMSREFCRDVSDSWGCSKSLCKKNHVHFSALPMERFNEINSGFLGRRSCN